MNFFDYFLVVFYLGLMLWLGRRFKQSEKRADYFLGGRQFGWFTLCMSTMATQLSAISFVSAPAFVGLRAGGGMKWLSYEFGVPLAMIAVMAGIAPLLHRAGVVSVYGFLEARFGTSSRLLLSSLFILSRSFGTGVGIYTIGLILSSMLGLPFWQTMLILGVVTIAYSLEGGMKAIVYSEVAQMLIKFSGIIVIACTAIHYIGGWQQFIAHVDQRRLRVIDLSNYGFDGREFGFWPMLIGGLFLYASYYGTDQTQAQRILSAKSETTVRQLLLFNGLFRFPVTLAYCIGGLALGTLALTSPDFASRLPPGKADLMVPVFISGYLPHGVVGLIVIALIAAWMSSYSSTLNSLTAVTMEDFLKRMVEIPEKRYVTYSKIVALIWGVVTMICGFYAGRIASTAIESINKIGSLFYGPILMIFLMAGIGFIKPVAANAGVIAGVLVNLTLWLFFKHVFWFWWNAIGGLVTLAVGAGLSALPFDRARPLPPAIARTLVFPWREASILLVYFAVIVTFCAFLPHFL